jgi:hypothetical protein
LFTLSPPSRSASILASLLEAKPDSSRTAQSSTNPATGEAFSGAISDFAEQLSVLYESRLSHVVQNQLNEFLLFVFCERSQATVKSIGVVGPFPGFAENLSEIIFGNSISKPERLRVDVSSRLFASQLVEKHHLSRAITNGLKFEESITTC